MENSVLNKNTSCFKNYRSPNDPRNVNLLTWLRSNKYAKRVLQIRALKEKKEKDKIKATLPAITPSGVFSPTRAKSALVEHTGLICLDIDLKENVQIANFFDLKEQLAKIENVAYCGLSVSGNGYFVLIPIETPRLHERHFDSLKSDFGNMGIVIDAACRDVSRLRGYSYDPDAYFNHHAVTYTKIASVMGEPPRRHYPRAVQSNEQLNNEGKIKLMVDEICRRRVDLTDGYDRWFPLGCVFANELGESGRGYFHDVSKFNPSYSYGKTDKQFSACLRSGNKGKGFGVKTLMKFCKDHTPSILLTDILERQKPISVNATPRPSQPPNPKAATPSPVRTEHGLEINQHGYPNLWDEPPPKLSKVESVLLQMKKKNPEVGKMIGRLGLVPI